MSLDNAFVHDMTFEGQEANAGLIRPVSCGD